MTDDASRLLTKIAMETSLRYAMHMIMCASLVANKRRAQEVDTEDIKRVYTLFVDVKRSTNFLMEYQQEFMFSTTAGGASGSQMQLIGEAKTDGDVEMA